MTANKPMTGEQLDELMTVAVNMQRDAETDCNRPSAMVAYAVQVAVLELRKVRNDTSALAAENAVLLAIMNEQAGSFNAALAEGFHDAVMGSGSNQVIDIYQRRLQPAIQCIPPTPETEAFLAEVRAQGVESAGEYLEQYAQGLHEEARLVLQDAGELCNGFAAQLRKGAQS